MMKLREYIDQMGDDQLRSYAKRCSISVNYLRLHVKYASKDPSVSLIKALFRESEGKVSLAAVLEHYRITEESILPKRLEGCRRGTLTSRAGGCHSRALTPLDGLRRHSTCIGRGHRVGRAPLDGYTVKGVFTVMSRKDLLPDAGPVFDLRQALYRAGRDYKGG